VSLRPIYLLGSPVLREQSSEVGEIDDEVRTLVADLFDTMKAASGIGLAANQVGLAIRVAVVEVENDDAVILIDPVITRREGKDRGEEGCLSIPEIFGDVDRALKIAVETTTLDGKRITVEASDLKARAIQHEVDHLDGILFLDHLSPLKRRMLVQKWKKLRKGKPALIEEVTAGKS
jgi:peptide deformylase